MPSVRYTRSPDASVSTVGDRVVLYHRVTRTALVLNPIGTLMWERLARPCDAAELVSDLRTRLRAVAQSDAERDVAAFLRDLSQHAMVSVA
jgi:hypothetical protein